MTTQDDSPVSSSAEPQSLPSENRDSLPPDSPPLEPPDNTETLLTALQFLGEQATVDVNRADARRALDEARQDARFVGPDACFEELTRAGAALGLTIRTVRRSSNDVVSRARAMVPALTFGAGATMVPRAIVGHRRGLVNVVDVETNGKSEWVSPAKLAARLGANDAADPIAWMIAEPSEPLASIAHHKHGATPWQRLVALLRLERDDVGVALVYAVGVGISSLAAPIGVQALVNTVAFGGLVQPLVVVTMLVLVGLAFGAVLRALWAWVVERIQQRIFTRVAVDLAYRLPRVRMNALRDAYGPELVNRFFDVLTVQKGAATLMVDGVSIALQTAVGMIVLAVYHPILLVFDVVLIFSVAFVLFIMGRGGVDTAVKESKMKYAVAAWLEQIAAAPTTFRSDGGGKYARARAEDALRNWLAARQKHWKLLFRQIIGSLVVQAVASAALLGVGGWLVIIGKLTLGQLVAAELIVTTVVSGIAKFGKHLESFYDLLAGVDKLGHLVDLPVEPPGGVPYRRHSKGAAIRLVDVSCAKPNGDKTLDHIRLTIEPGARVAILGPSGSGKSTLIDLLYGLRAPSRGHVDIDGIDLRDIDVASLREQIAFVRSIEIFEGTVADNVRMGRRDIQTRDVRRALDAVSLYDEMMALPEGLDTVLATGGPALSQGQALRLCIARALAHKPRLFVMDIALGDLDPVCRKAIGDAIFAPGAPWTVILTTHDREMLRSCDEIHVIDQGKLRPMRATDLAARANEERHVE